MRSADHPRSCRVCHGTGWAPGEPLFETVAGRGHRYDTWRPCDHHWADDDNGWRIEDQPIRWDDPRARNAYDHGYQRGHTELAAIRPPVEVVEVVDG